MKKRILALLFCAAILSMLAGCDRPAAQTTQQSSPPANPAGSAESAQISPEAPTESPAVAGTSIGEGSKERLERYVDSGEWSNDYVERLEWEIEENSFSYEITASKIFDLDGDGVYELWFAAYESSEPWNAGMSGFYTVVDDGEPGVKSVLLCEVSGGTIGGDYIRTAYDTQSGRHVLVKIAAVGGFGGNYGGYTFYDYTAGVLTELASREITTYSDENEPDEYMVNGNPATREEYEQAVALFTETTDPKYAIEEDYSA